MHFTSLILAFSLATLTSAIIVNDPIQNFDQLNTSPSRPEPTHKSPYGEPWFGPPASMTKGSGECTEKDFKELEDIQDYISTYRRRIVYVTHREIKERGIKAASITYSFAKTRHDEGKPTTCLELRAARNYVKGLKRGHIWYRALYTE